MTTKKSDEFTSATGFSYRALCVDSGISRPGNVLWLVTGGDAALGQQLLVQVVVEGIFGLGGFFFGWVIGSILTIFGATIGACILFIFSKSIFGKYLNRKIKNNKGMFASFEKNIKDNAFNYLLFMRLMPLFPFVFVNIAPALLDVRLFTYIVTTFLGIIPATIIYSLLGSGASDAFMSGNLIHIKNLVSYEIIIGLIGLSILSLISMLIISSH